MKINVRLVLCAALVGLALASPNHQGLAAQEKPALKGRGWTYEEAVQQLRFSPRDAYLQYVVMQLGRRENRAAQMTMDFDRIMGRDDNFARNERVNRVDLFSLFSGSLAVQESLQLDTMRGPAANRGEGMRRSSPPTIRPAGEPTPPPVKVAAPIQEKPVPTPAAPEVARAEPEVRQPLVVDERRKNEKVKVSSLRGPTIKSHPWTQMLAGRKPEVGSLSKCVPEDFYFVEFRSLSKLMEVMDQSDLWGTHLFSQAAQEARTQLVGDRLKKQLAVETNNLLRPFYDVVVDEVAVTGSDLYVREGSDVTLLFRNKQPDVFKARMNGFLTNAEKSEGAKRTEGEFFGVSFIHVTTPDRSVHVYSAYPSPELHVRSNSRVGFERVIEAVLSKTADGKSVRRLGDSEEFAYVRTLMPRGAQEEDGFVYLSDPFIRRIVGPSVKLTERRRMIAYNHLRMIGHAALMYRTEFGKSPTSFEELAKAGCSPGVFGQGELVCPEGGKYSLSPDGMTGVSSHYGTAQFLTPCCEIPVKEVLRDEAEEYNAFLNEYNQYWRTFFDPIALRIQLTPKRYRIETIVLPLLDNSIYTNMARAFGGKAESLDAMPVPKRNIFSMALRLDKHALMKDAGLEEFLKESKEEPVAEKKEPTWDAHETSNAIKQLALAMHNYHDSYNRFPGSTADPMRKGRLSWRVHLLPFLEQLDLYEQFKLDEDWDSEHNKKLVAKMPAIFRSANSKVAAQGKTGYVVPVGPDTIFPDNGPPRRISEIVDGMSMTIMFAEVDDEHAVVWTKPDDLRIDPKNPLTGLVFRPPGISYVGLADGSVAPLKQTADPKTVAAMFTRAGGETFDMQSAVDQPPGGRRRHGLSGFEQKIVERLNLGQVLAKGVGNQIAFHICDAEPMFDLNVAQLLGMGMGTFGGRSPLGIGGMEVVFLPYVAALNGPVYLSMPVQDPKIIDDFLLRLDGLLAEVVREKERLGGFITISHDVYQLQRAGEKSIRAYALRFGPMKLRFFWGRVGNGLYVASKPFIFEDLMAAEANKTPAVDVGPAAHAMVRLRPQHWKQVLDDYRLGWAENNREACLNNLGPLASLGRSMAGKPAAEIEKELERLSARLYGVQFFCPEDGRYTCSADGKSCTCSIHGSAQAPKQAFAPSEKSSLGKLLREFSDMTLALTFLEDGLHAVVTIERK
jgi:hypothetical protein